MQAPAMVATGPSAEYHPLSKAEPGVSPVDPPSGPSDTSTTPLRVQSTLELLARARGGDSEALDVVFGRCVPALRRWAHGRLPVSARALLETQDVVMEAVMSVFRRLDDFDPRFSGALQAYLRQAVLNRIRDELRRVTRRPVELELGYDDYAASDASPLELAIGAERVERYDAALQRLRLRDRELIVARLELQQSYQDIAAAMGQPTANAARAAVVRAMYRLSREIQRES